MKPLFLNIKHVALIILLGIQMEAIGQKHKNLPISSENNLIKFDTIVNRLLPIRIPGLADKQINHYTELLRPQFVSYCKCNPEEYLLDVDALKKLLRKYDSLHPNKATFLQIELSEIKSSNTSISYYEQNPKKLHYIFHLLDQYKTKIDGLTYDLSAGVTNLNNRNHHAYQIPTTDVQNFNQAFTSNSLPKLGAIEPQYNQNSIFGLQFVNIPISHIMNIFNNDANFNQFSISLGLIRTSDAPTTPVERREYASFEGMDKVLNLLFQKRNLSPPNPTDINYYDLNDLCPPGSCY